jgi:hypothetical protein
VVSLKNKADKPGCSVALVRYLVRHEYSLEIATGK